VRSQGKGQTIERDWTQRAGNRNTKLPHVEKTRDSPTLIVGDDRDKREILPNCGFQISHIESECTVARQKEDGTLGER
jgi:hypothetical protein